MTDSTTLIRPTYPMGGPQPVGQNDVLETANRFLRENDMTYSEVLAEDVTATKDYYVCSLTDKENPGVYSAPSVTLVVRMGDGLSGMVLSKGDEWMLDDVDEDFYVARYDAAFDDFDRKRRSVDSRMGPANK